MFTQRRGNAAVCRPRRGVAQRTAADRCHLSLPGCKDRGWREAFVYRLPTGELVAVFFDVGERIRAEARLSESEQRYRALVERQPDLICQFLADTTLTFVNDAYTRYFGRSRKELIGTRWIDLIPANERAQCFADVAAITPEHRRRNTRAVGGRAERHEALVPLALPGIFRCAGDAIGYQAFGTDLTDRRRDRRSVARKRRPAQRRPRSRAGADLDQGPGGARHPRQPPLRGAGWTVVAGHRHQEPVRSLSGGRTEEMSRSDLAVLASGDPCEIEEELCHYDGTVHTYLTIKVRATPVMTVPSASAPSAPI